MYEFAASPPQLVGVMRERIERLPEAPRPTAFNASVAWIAFASRDLAVAATGEPLLVAVGVGRVFIQSRESPDVVGLFFSASDSAWRKSFCAWSIFAEKFSDGA